MMKKIILHVLLPLLVIAGGLASAVVLSRQVKKAKMKPANTGVQVVEVIEATLKPLSTRITATGSVVPARQVTLTPEVTGRIVKLSKALIPGSRIKKGQIIARVDSRDYELAITQEKSRVHQSELELELETGRSQIAARELKLLGRGGDKATSVSPLAMRKPQLEVAKQNTESAKSGLSRAELNLSRTVLRAPFNAMVLNKLVDLGQLVGPATPVGPFSYTLL